MPIPFYFLHFLQYRNQETQALRSLPTHKAPVGDYRTKELLKAGIEKRLTKLFFGLFYAKDFLGFVSCSRVKTERVLLSL